MLVGEGGSFAEEKGEQLRHIRGKTRQKRLLRSLHKSHMTASPSQVPVPKCGQHGEQTGGIRHPHAASAWTSCGIAHNLVWNGSQDGTAAGDGHRLFRKDRLGR